MRYRVLRLKQLLPDVQIDFDPGRAPTEAALLAKRSDVAIVFGIRVEGESFDLADLSLPWGQDAVIDAVASVNPNTIVMLETGKPCVNAVAQQGECDRAGVVPRAGRRAG